MKTANLDAEMKNSPLHKLFIEQLQDIYWAETHLLKALPKMAKAATSQELSTAFEEHLDITEVQVERLEEVFSLLEEKAKAKTCQAMKGLIEESEEMIKNTEKDTMVRDCGLIIAAQKVEHYEIASYGSLRTLAEIMGHNEVMELLQATLDEEHHADNALNSIALSFINKEAKQEVKAE
jgi:ferritin-like metal-binding protein YciE